jgi:hypothetical protein
MLVGGLLVALTAARVSPEAGAVAAMLLGCVSAGLIFLAGMFVDQKYVIGGTGFETDAARADLIRNLVAFAPGLSVSTAPSPAAPAATQAPAPPLPTFQTLLPRSTTAIVITLSAALLGALVTANWVSREAPKAPERVVFTDRATPAELAARPDLTAEAPAAAIATQAAASPATPTVATPTAATAAPPTTATPSAPPKTPEGTIALTGTCTCHRADSLLWRDGLPHMSTVLIDKKTKEHNGHVHLELELGVVNNWDQAIPEVSLVVQFYDRDPPPSSRRVPTFDRPLYFEGPLEPGQAIKWHVEARGTEFEVNGKPEPMLDPGGADAAATNLLVDLLKANHRPIRLHGAMMLAYLGDPRAKDGALALREALREDEAPYIDRLMWTLGEIRTCSVEVSEGANPHQLNACVFNGSAEPREKLALRVRALDRPFRHDTPVEAPPLVIAERLYKLSGALPPNQGSMVTVSFDTTNPDGVAPKAFEAFADREELVF